MLYKDLKPLLRAGYVVLAPADDEWQAQYFKTDALPLSGSEVITAVEPVPCLKKTLFETDAADTDYVAALKLFYQKDTKTGDATVSSETDSSTDNAQTSETDSSTTQNGFNPFFPFGAPADLSELLQNPELLKSMSAFMTPEMMEQARQFATPETLAQLMQTPEFKKIYDAVDLSALFPGGLGDLLSAFKPSGPSPADSGDDDEYEEI